MRDLLQSCADMLSITRTYAQMHTHTLTEVGEGDRMGWGVKGGTDLLSSHLRCIVTTMHCKHKSPRLFLIHLVNGAESTDGASRLHQ